MYTEDEICWEAYEIKLAEAMKSDMDHNVTETKLKTIFDLADFYLRRERQWRERLASEAVQRGEYVKRYSAPH